MWVSVMRHVEAKSSALRTASIINMQAPREHERELHGKNEVAERQAPPADLFERTRPG